MYVFLSVSNWSSCIYFLYYFLETILYGIISFYFFYKKHNIQCLWPVINCSRHKSVTRWPSFRALCSPTPREASALHHCITSPIYELSPRWWRGWATNGLFTQLFPGSSHSHRNLKFLIILDVNMITEHSNATA